VRSQRSFGGWGFPWMATRPTGPGESPDCPKGLTLFWAPMSGFPDPGHNSPRQAGGRAPPNCMPTFCYSVRFPSAVFTFVHRSMGLDGTEAAKIRSLQEDVPVPARYTGGND